MDGNLGFANSWSGVVDYSACYHIVHGCWLVTQSALFFGTGLSLVPQLFRIINLRTSYGIAPTFVTITTIAQLLIVLNIFCLHTADFEGLLQIGWQSTLPRLLTFCVAFMLWFAYLPVVFLVPVFFDTQPRLEPARPSSTVVRERKAATILFCLIVSVDLLLLIPYFGLAASSGFSSSKLAAFGRIAGLVSSAISVVQYLPQFISVCKLKDNASFSLVTLAIQAPGGTVSTLSMVIGQGEDWSTWLSMGVSALQQWILLGICIWYKARGRCGKEAGTEGSMELSRPGDGLAPVDPQPLLFGGGE
jgi:uncharacterized protein with PQ loop repeat